MSRGLNQVTIMGNLTRDPEVKYTNNNTAFCNVNIACNYAKKTQGGVWEDAVDFVPVTLWDKTAETLGKYVGKGDAVVITGKIQTRSWDDKDGNKRYKTEVVGKQLLLIGGKKSSGKTTNEVDDEWCGDEEVNIPF